MGRQGNPSIQKAGAGRLTGPDTRCRTTLSSPKTLNDSRLGQLVRGEGAGRLSLGSVSGPSLRQSRAHALCHYSSNSMFIRRSFLAFTARRSTMSVA